MRLPRPILAVLGAAACLLSSASGSEFVLFRSVWGNTIVNTDMTAEGRALTPATVEAPVYYLGKSLGTYLGSIPGDEEPTVREVNKFVTKLLAKQGYLAARPGVHDPTLFVVMQWGYMKPGYSETDRAWFLGYNDYRDAGSHSRELDTIIEFFPVPLYGIIVTAFDYASVRTPKPVIYWQTRIALPADGKTMAAALPAMFIAGAPAFGRETRKPILRDADTLREGHVKLGDLKFLDVMPAANDKKP